MSAEEAGEGVERNEEVGEPELVELALLVLLSNDSVAVVVRVDFRLSSPQVFASITSMSHSAKKRCHLKVDSATKKS